jgi:hypothetical protein
VGFTKARLGLLDLDADDAGRWSVCQQHIHVVPYYAFDSLIEERDCGTTAQTGGQSCLNRRPRNNNNNSNCWTRKCTLSLWHIQTYCNTMERRTVGWSWTLTDKTNKAYIFLVQRVDKAE